MNLKVTSTDCGTFNFYWEKSCKQSIFTSKLLFIKDFPKINIGIDQNLSSIA